MLPSRDSQLCPVLGELTGLRKKHLIYSSFLNSTELRVSQDISIRIAAGFPFRCVGRGDLSHWWNFLHGKYPQHFQQTAAYTSPQQLAARVAGAARWDAFPSDYKRRLPRAMWISQADCHVLHVSGLDWQCWHSASLKAKPQLSAKQTDRVAEALVFVASFPTSSITSCSSLHRCLALTF